MRVVCFYTKDTPYEAEAELWAESWKSVNTCQYVMYPQTTWVANCALKPIVIQRALEDYDTDILYVDVDSRLVGHPLWEYFEGRDTPGFAWLGKELLSGTIYLPNNDKTKKLVDLWADTQRANPGKWDQKVLQHIVMSKRVEHFELDHDWINVDGHIKTKTAIINHEQASRRYKEVVSANNRILQ